MDQIDPGRGRSMTDRMIGAATLDIATYEEVEHDTSATTQAAIVVGIVAVCAAVCFVWVYFSYLYLDQQIAFETFDELRADLNIMRWWTTIRPRERQRPSARANSRAFSIRR